MKKRISVVFLIIAVLTAFFAAGCGEKEQPLTEKLPPKVDRGANGPSVGAPTAPTSGTAVKPGKAN